MTDCWNTLKAAYPLRAAAGAPLQAAQLRTLVATRYQRENKRIGRYAVGAVVWQTLVYASLSYLALRFRTDRATVACCALGVLLYLPFTLVFARHFRQFMQQRRVGYVTPAEAIYPSVVRQYGLLQRFFRFKKRFDLVATPVTGFVLVALFMRVGWVPPLGESIGPAAFLFVLIVSVFTGALQWENRHQFAGPLRRLRALRHDLEAGTAR